MESIKSMLYIAYYQIAIYIIAFLSLLDEIQYKLGLKRRFNAKTDFPGNLKGRVAVVTGGTRGLGLTVVRELLAKGCYVFVASSQPSDKFPTILDKIYSDIDEVDKVTGIKRGEVALHHLDLSTMESVKKFAKEFADSKLDLNYLICNAGIMFAPRSISSDGFEMHLAVNYLGHCLLTMEFLPILIKTSIKTQVKCRIINVASSTHRATSFDFEDVRKTKLYSAAQAYAQSKLAQIMFTSKLARVLKASDYEKYVQVFCLHPGVVVSDLYEHVLIIRLFPKITQLVKLITRNIVEGAETTLYTVMSSELDSDTDKYLEDCAFKKPSRASRNINNQERLWHLTHLLLKTWIPENYKNMIKID